MSSTKPGTLLKELVPVWTFADGDQEQAGFLEVDLVSPCTESAEGFYQCTLHATDIHAGWTEGVAVCGAKARRVGKIGYTVRKRLPFRMAVTAFTTQRSHLQQQ